MKQLTPEELSAWMGSGRRFQLVDVREDWEHEAYNIGGALVPIGAIMSMKDSLSRSVPVVLYCEKGVRSAIAIQRLEALGFDNLYNLAGGMKAWRQTAGHAPDITS